MAGYGAAFATAVLPLVNACSPAAAATIEASMKLGAAKIDEG